MWPEIHITPQPEVHEMALYTCILGAATTLCIFSLLDFLLQDLFVDFQVLSTILHHTYVV